MLVVRPTIEKPTKKNLADAEMLAVLWKKKRKKERNALVV